MRLALLYPNFGNPEYYVNLLGGFAKAWEVQGHVVHVGPMLSGAAIQFFVEWFRPDVVLEVNRCRKQAAFYPPHVVHVCWLHDIYSSAEEDMHANFGGSDLVYSIVDPANLGFADHPVAILLPAVDPAVFSREPGGDRRLDVVFTGYMPPPITFMCGRTIELFGPRGEGIHYDCWPLAQALYDHSDIWQFCTPFTEVREWIIRYISHDTGLPESAVRRGYDRNVICKRYLETELLRYKDRKKMLDSVARRVKSLAIFGHPEAWSAHPEYARHYRGEMSTPAQMAALNRQSRLCLHNGALGMHTRVLEAMACGAVPLVSKTPYDVSAGGIECYLRHGTHYFGYSLDDVGEVVGAALEDDLAAISMAASEKIRQEHAWANRVTQMLSDIEAHAPLHSLQ